MRPTSWYRSIMIEIVDILAVHFKTKNYATVKKFKLPFKCFRTILDESSLGRPLNTIRFWCQLFRCWHLDPHGYEHSCSLVYCGHGRDSHPFLSIQPLKKKQDKHPPNSGRWFNKYVRHPDFGRLEFVSLRLPKRYLGVYQDLDVVVAVPTAASEEGYQKLQ